ncbi:DUF3794 and LysM peptidoglycan-binding domain-containing protein [Clostridium fallax]|uniref:LysM domain-containing protein n=1 Tax=Clostridium fallax TaxID=1533 RepID=A0A1M4WHV5_9CLOT|nr:SPOCS domain-containing protein [Clostridium fallax]SHE80818.1 protein of unknown function [Clostridium fallax]SQB05717.1 peptidoglycan-binding LysM [Clostridium fallax]
MADIDVLKETIEYEQLFEQIENNPVIRGEYLIPDTHPDVVEILNVQGKVIPTHKEVQQDRILVEGKVDYNIIYLAREEEGLGVHCVGWNDKFTNYIDLVGAEHRMICDAECEIEHINSNIINERKIGIEIIPSIKCDIYKAEEFEYVKEIEGSADIEMRKKTEVFDKVIYKKNIEMSGKCKMQVPMDKPQIGSILKCMMTPHNKEVKIIDGKVNISCYCKIEIVYRASDSRDILSLEEDIYLTQEEELLSPELDVIPIINFRENEVNYALDKDDLGEDRIIDIESVIEGDLKVISKEHIELIEDAYSPTRLLELKKDSKNISLLIGEGNSESIAKDNLSIPPEEGSIVQIVSVSGNLLSLDKKIERGKVILNGMVRVNVIYKTTDEEKGIGTVEGEIPFSNTIDIKEANIGMKYTLKAWIETMEANIEANTIAIKAIIAAKARIFDMAKKSCVTFVEEKEGESPTKNASLTIYIVQKGDTLWNLAKKYNTTVEDLVNINNIDNPDVIEAGEKLIIPGRAIL